jgi:WD40 repeat protein
MYVKAFRLFVSSTFKDFAQEREVLQSKVFPALDANCAARGWQFHAVDLRWGVNEEAQLDQRTADICLGEVRAAKDYPAPNFLVMIGDRYGWVPLPFAIARDEFEAALAWLDSLADHDAVRDLRRVYQLDENHVIQSGLIAASGVLAVASTATTPDTSAYTLRSREDEVNDLKDAKAWEELEARVRSALQAVANNLLRLDQIDAAGHQKYFLSLTEQEIICALSGAQDGPATLGQMGADEPKAIAWIRESAAPLAPLRVGLLRRWLGMSPRSALSEPLNPDPRVATLAAAIRHELPDDCVVMTTATTGTDGKFNQSYLDTFASSIQRKLEAAVDKHIEAIQAVERAPDFELQSERVEQRAFADDRRKVFVGRENNRSAIAHYIRGGTGAPLVLHGNSGSGKSALMACAVAEVEATCWAPVIYRFIGASATSSDLRAMLISLVDDLAAHDVAQKPQQWEDDDSKFVDQVRALLSAIDKPVVIFLDGLDQLRKPWRPGWLPAALPDGAKIIVSVLDDEAFPIDSGIHRSLRQRLPADAFLEIEPLNRSQGEDILRALEKLSQRRLQQSQRDYIVGQFEKAGGSPLYLRIAFEIARAWRSYDLVGQGHCVLPADTTALIAQFIRDLSEVHHHEPEVVTRTLGYLGAAKEGLSAKEVTEVLSRDRDVMNAISSEKHGVRTEKLPPSVWVRLNRQLAPLLVEKRTDDQPLMQFFHRQLAQVVLEQHYKPAKVALHGALAAYFGDRVIRRDEKDIYDKRSLSELPYQLHCAENKSRLSEILTSPDWMQQKLAAFDPQALVADYDQFGDGSTLPVIGQTARLISGICGRDRHQLLPQLFCRLLDYPDPSVSAFRDRVRSSIIGPALLTQSLSLTPPGVMSSRLDGHESGVWALCMLADGRLASGSDDGTILIWDLTTNAEVGMLRGHTSSVTALVMLPDGRLASGSSDKTVRIWELTLGVENASPVRCKNSISALAVSPDAHLVVGLTDGSIEWLNPAGNADAVVKGHGGEITSLLFLPDGRLASSSSDSTIRLWDSKTRTQVDRLDGHKLPINGLVLLPDGRMASASDDTNIRLWDVTSGAASGVLDRHRGKVKALAVLSDGRLVSSCNDNTIRLWDIRTSTESVRLDNDEAYSQTLALLPDGRLAGGSADKAIRLWDFKNGTKSILLSVHDDAVTSLAILPNNRLASGSADGSVQLWDIKTRTRINALSHQPGQVSALASLSTGELAAGSGKNIQLWQPTTGTKVTHLVGLNYPVRSLAELKDCRLAAACKGTIRVWDFKTRTEVSQLIDHMSGVRTLAAFADGRLASGGKDKIVRVWNTDDRSVIHRLVGHTKQVNAVVVLPDSRLASGSSDHTIRIWSAETGIEVGRLDQHRGAVRGLTVLLEGRRLASCADDKTIRLWDSETCREITRLEVDAVVLCLVSTSDGKLIAGDALGRLHWLEIVE